MCKRDGVASLLVSLCAVFRSRAMLRCRCCVACRLMLRRGFCLCSLFEGQQCFNVVGVALGYQAEVGQVAFLLLGFFGQDVALVSMFSFDLS